MSAKLSRLKRLITNINFSLFLHFPIFLSIFSREFYYIQMEKYARQAVSEGMKNVDEIHVGGDSEIYRVLNLHYNRNNHIEVRFGIVIVIRIFSRFRGF